MRKFLIFVISIIFTTVSVQANEPDIHALGAVLMDKDSGRVLWQKNGDKGFAPASTTKIMTAVIALENAKLDDKITVTANAAKAPKVKMYLSEGEEITVEQLLYALMMQSSNDAAVALAEGIGGSVENFCGMMTKKAESLGCRDTVFETPNGLDTQNHHSTPHDMAIIAAYALDNEDFMRIINTPEVSFTTSKNTYHIVNKDRFLKEYDGAIGIKTGFTGKAGHCFVGAAKRGDTTLISVVFASGWGSEGKNRKWSDTKHLMDHGFENYHYKQLINKGAFLKEIYVKNGKAEKVSLLIGEDYGTLLKNGEKISLCFDSPKAVEAPIKQGERVGTARLSIEGQRLAELPIVTGESIEGKRFKDWLRDIFEIWSGLCGSKKADTKSA